MKPKTNVVISAGRHSGSTRRSSSVPKRAPSIRAASSNSVGISATALTRSIKVSGRLTTARIRPSPTFVSSKPNAAYIRYSGMAKMIRGTARRFTTSGNSTRRNRPRRTISQAIGNATIIGSTAPINAAASEFPR